MNWTAFCMWCKTEPLQHVIITALRGQKDDHSVLRTLIRAHAHYERGANNAGLCGCIKDRGRDNASCRRRGASLALARTGVFIRRRNGIIFGYRGGSNSGRAVGCRGFPYPDLDTRFVAILPALTPCSHTNCLQCWSRTLKLSTRRYSINPDLLAM